MFHFNRQASPPTSAPAHPLQRHRRRDWFIGSALLFSLIILVEYAIGWSQLLTPWRTLPLSTIFILFGCMAISYTLRAVRIYDDFYSLMRRRFKTTLRLSILHTTANVLLPMRLGEVVFPWLMQRYFNHNIFAAGASLIWIRLLDLHFLALTGLFILWLVQPSWLWIFAILLWLFLLLAQRWIASFGQRWRGQIVLNYWQRGVLLIANAAPDDTIKMIRLYVWTALSWITKFIAFTTVLQHFLPITFWQVLTGVIGAELSSVLPFHGIAGAGSYELALVAAVLPLGIKATAALAGAVNLHLFMLSSSILLGLLALLLRVQRAND
ncbi:flippase-like domain-containing protein [Rhodoferax sp. 4810]|uniref:Flippase-like domain-containing protein n=1 Tax=Thiospirillum jenense TaxID=1653858 RepID=A0A839HIE9_9GAMM|nr:lysylphosphatidylglycerol synthase transmembrane domain-containing protein [Thiospirillum jenense]MBB1075467.1 flippase-like domain-containing protein [Rhodoferax jenense]MBB1126846.1 flippase-like domain-containing protein [Thiospirillum jenense]